MRALIENDLTRAGTFFVLAFGSTVIFAAVLGDIRLGIETGLVVGVAFAAFAYVFIKPTPTGEDDTETGAPETECEETKQKRE